MNDTIQKAINFARMKHKDQKDDSGFDYFTAHLDQVASIVSQVTDDPDIIAAAYLHDVLEDTDTTFDELSTKFHSYIATMVSLLTKRNGKFGDIGIMRGATIIKFADRLSNLSRMEAWSDARKAAYINKSAFWKNG